MNYKLVIFGKHIYQEVPLPEDQKEPIAIGTKRECAVRFNRSQFFDDFLLELMPKNGEWHISCRESVFLMTGNALKQYGRTLEYGDTMSLHYEKSGAEFLQMEFLVDFRAEEKPLDMFLDLRGTQEISVGGSRGNLFVLCSPLLAEEELFLKRDSAGTWKGRVSGIYGLYINGTRRKEREAVVQEGDFFAFGGCPFYLKEEKLYYSSAGGVYAERETFPLCNQVNHLEYPKFRRNTREQYVFPEEKTEIQRIKQKANPPKKNLLLTLAPSVISILLMILLRGVMGGGGMFMIYGVCMMTVGAVMSVINYKNSGKEYEKEQILREQKYRQYIAQKEEEIARLRRKERDIRFLKYPSLEKDLQMAADFDSRLFERRKEDEDYLCVYLGEGDVKARCQVKYPAMEQMDTEDPLTELPEQLERKYELLTGVPVAVDLKDKNALGITGSRSELYEIVKRFSLDIAIRQFYQDVKLFYLLDEKDMEQFAWLRWLRNTGSQESGKRNFFYDAESKKSGLERLYGDLAYREGCGEGMRKAMPKLVIFVYRSEDFLSHPVSRYVSRARELGAVFIFLEEYKELLPQGCASLITLEHKEGAGRIREAANAEQVQSFRYTYVSDKDAEEAARRLGCIYIEDINLESSLTSNISLYGMLGIFHAKDIDLKKQWSASRVYESMAAPLGIKGGNEIVSLDLHEKAHGPHGLVAGTTGSGKSEILQTYILSMALLFHPYEVSFVIIDFKGGGMVNQFRRLPHLTGAITNIDGKAMNRSLMSIRAELQKRQELFAQAEVNHIDAYIRKYKEGEVKLPLPHLILIVDEFAELKTNQPEFMKELISTARIGRSLGVHLILATQKPNGVVDDQIWSNSKFRLCLKVQNKEDSKEVLKSPLAAEIKEPGRAYLQVGNNELFLLFQSAYSGAPVYSDSMGRQREYQVNAIDMAGRRKVIFEYSNKQKEETETQLEEVVSYIHDYCEEQGIEKLPDICMQPLPKLLLPREEEGESREKDFVVKADIGILDDPERQVQEKTEVEFTRQNIFILGAPGYGKTNLIQQMLRELAKNYSPARVQIYIADFATMILKSMEGLRHIGGVVAPYEDEKLKNLMKLLLEELESRKNKLSKMGLSSYYAYLEGGYQELPQIIFILENLTGFRELYPQYEEAFLRLCREGLSCGISIVVTNGQSSGVSYRYYTNFSKRISLFCNNSSEYCSLFDRCRTEPDNLPGRAILELDRKIYECQTYLAFAGEREVERAQKVREFVAAVNRRYEGSRARRIPEIPSVLTEAYLEKQIIQEERKPYTVALGLDYTTTEVLWLNLLTLGVLGICSTQGLGRRNFIRWALTCLEKNREEEAAECYVADGLDRTLSDLEDLQVVKKYSFHPGNVCEWLKEIDEKLQERYDKILAGEEMTLKNSPLIVLLLHNQDAVSAVQADKEAMECYRRICGKYKTMKVCIMFTDLENAAISYNAPEPLKILKESRNFLVFEDLPELKLCDVPLAKAREFKKPLEQGDAYRIQGTALYKVKTVLCKGGVEFGNDEGA